MSINPSSYIVVSDVEREIFIKFLKFKKVFEGRISKPSLTIMYLTASLSQLSGIVMVLFSLYAIVSVSEEIPQKRINKK